MDDWAAAGVSALQRLHPDCHRSLRRLFTDGIDLTTHYSGTGTAEAAVAALASLMAPGIETQSSPVSCHSACDISPVCQEVLSNHPAASRPHHRFSDLCERPNADVMKRLRATLKGFQKKAGLIRGGLRTPSPSKVQLESDNWVSAAMQMLSEWTPSRDSLTDCLRHGRSCKTYPPRVARRHHLEVSGINCQPWSQAGMRWGWLDERSIPCLILVRIIMAIKPDFVCIECTPRFDFRKLQSLLQPTFRGEFAITSPRDFGLPVDRKRMYMWFDNCSVVSSAMFPMADLSVVMKRTQELTLDVFLRASPAEVQQYYHQLLAVNRRRRSCGRRRLRLDDVLSAGNVSRLRKYREMVATLPDASCYVVDVHKSPDWGAKPRSSQIPTLLRSSILVALRAPPEEDRLLLPSELPALHGLKLSPDLVSRLPAADVRSLVGNSMHMVQVGLFVQFALSTRRLRSHVSVLPAGASSPGEVLPPIAGDDHAIDIDSA
jgi:site-specific DNA-cytosine methylase